MSLLINFFDYYFNRFYWSFTSRYWPPSLLTAAIVGSSSSYEVYFNVFAYQLPNLMMEGMIAMIMKKLMTKIAMSMVLCVKKLIYLLKMMERCLE